mgnify:CR=1 FL=1
MQENNHEHAKILRFIFGDVDIAIVNTWIDFGFL